MRTIYFVIICLISILSFSCNKDKKYVNHSISIPKDTTNNSNSPETQKKIKNSIKIHDDNVNGVYFRKTNRIQEAVFYFYNDDLLLDSLIVLSDTSRNAKILRTLKLNYLPDQNKVEAYMYNQTNGHFYMEFIYDENKKVLAISNKNYSKEMGVFYIYDDEMLSHQKYDFGKVAIITNMRYDTHGNLTKFENYAEVEEYFKVDLEYDLSKEVSPTFDIKFNSVEIQFLYEGGVNIIDLMGLNIGTDNKHLISKRVESYLYDNNTIRNTYNYQYNFDEWGRMKNRSILLNNKTEIYFEYNY